MAATTINGAVLDLSPTISGSGWHGALAWYPVPEVSVVSTYQRASVYWDPDVAWEGPGGRPVLIDSDHSGWVQGHAKLLSEYDADDFLVSWVAAGGVVVSIGHVGFNFPGVSDRFEAVPEDTFASSQWDDPERHWQEKDAYHARKWVAERIADGQILGDNDRVFLRGYAVDATALAVMGLGPDRTWSGHTSDQAGRSLQCRGMILLSPIAWYSAYLGTLQGGHWISNVGTVNFDTVERYAATTISQVDTADLKQSSPHAAARESGAMGPATPCYIVCTEAVGSEDFTVDGSNDPSLSTTLAINSRQYWHGIMLYKCLTEIAGTASSRAWHIKQSELAATSAIQLASGDPSTVTITGGVLDADVDAKTLAWAMDQARSIYGVTLDLTPTILEASLSPVIVGEILDLSPSLLQAYIEEPPAEIAVVGVILSLPLDILAGTRSDSTLTLPVIDSYTPDEVTYDQGQNANLVPTTSGGLATTWEILANPWDSVQAPSLDTVDPGVVLPVGELPPLTETYAFLPANYPAWTAAGGRGDALFEVRSDRYIDLRTGEQSNVGQYGEQPAGNILAAALYKANEEWVSAGKTGTITIRVHGNLKSTCTKIKFGGSEEGIKSYKVAWTEQGGPDGATPIPIDGLVIVGVNQDKTQDIIPTFSMGEYVGSNRYGVDWIRFEWLGIENSDGGSQAISGMSAHDIEFGRLVLVDCHLRYDRDNWNSTNYGLRWGVMIQCPGRYHFLRVSCDQCSEHFFYVDDINVTHGDYTADADWKSYFVDCTNEGPYYDQTDPNGFYGGGCNHSFLYFVSRATEWTDLSMTAIPMGGFVLIDGCTGWDLGVGENAAAITWANFLVGQDRGILDGTCLIRDFVHKEGPRNRWLTSLYHEPARTLLVWQERQDTKGTRYTSDGYLGERLVIDTISVQDVYGTAGVLPSCADTHVQISGVKDVQVWDFNLGNDTAKHIFEFDAEAPLYAYAGGGQTSNSPPTANDWGDGYGSRAAGSLCAMCGAVRFFIADIANYSGWNDGDGSDPAEVAYKVRVGHFGGTDPAKELAWSDVWTTLYNYEIAFLSYPGNGTVPLTLAIDDHGDTSPGTIDGTCTEAWPDFGDDTLSFASLHDIPRIATSDPYIDSGPTLMARDVHGVHAYNATGSAYAQVAIGITDTGVIDMIGVPLVLTPDLLEGTIAFASTPTTITGVILDLSPTVSAATILQGSFGWTFSIGLNGFSIRPYVDNIPFNNIVRAGYYWQYYNRQTSLIVPLTHAKGFAVLDAATGCPDLTDSSYAPDGESSSGYWACCTLFTGWTSDAYPPINVGDSDQYVIRWSGPGNGIYSCDIFGPAAANLVLDSGNYVIRKVQRNGSLGLLIKEAGISNPQVYFPGADTAKTWNALYVSRIKEVVGPSDWFRTMDWNTVNMNAATARTGWTSDPDVHGFPFRSDAGGSNPTWGLHNDATGGNNRPAYPVPEKAIFDWWEELGCNLWFNWAPTFAEFDGTTVSDGLANYIRDFAAEVLVRLNKPGLAGKKIGIEVSNEVWADVQGGVPSPQKAWFLNHAATGDSWPQSFGKYCDGLWSLLLAEGIPRDRILLVQGGWIASPNDNWGIFQNITANNVDALAVAGYAGVGPETLAAWRYLWTNDPTQTYSPTVDEIFTEIYSQIERLRGYLANLQTQVGNWTTQQSGHTVQLVCYEYGQGMYPDEFWAAAAYSSYSDERMVEVYRRLHQAYADYGVTFALAYADIDEANSTDGSWGHRKNLYDDDSAMPRWRALTGERIVSGAILDLSIDVLEATITPATEIHGKVLVLTPSLLVATVDYTAGTTIWGQMLTLTPFLYEGTMDEAVLISGAVLDLSPSLLSLSRGLSLVGVALDLSPSLLAAGVSVDGLIVGEVLTITPTLLVAWLNTGISGAVLDVGPTLLVATVLVPAAQTITGVILDLSPSILQAGILGLTDYRDAHAVVVVGIERGRVFGGDP